MKAIILLLVLALVANERSTFGQDSPQTNGAVSGQSTQVQPQVSPSGARSSGSGLRGGGVSGGRRGGGSFGNSQGPFGNSQSSDYEAADFAPFDLDFRGGTPGLLVMVIEKASGRPLNAIVPAEFQDMQLPALRMKGVILPRLFEALVMASAKQVAQVTGTYFGGGGGRGSSQYQVTRTSYGFRTIGTPTPDSVWYFFCEEPVLPPDAEPMRACRFYQLSPYLEKYSIDDITTAIQTGWKMLGDRSIPTMNFHKDTSLLIAVGEPEKLRLIDSALAELSGPKKSDTNVPAPTNAGRQ